jgi:hypothetical protein
VLGEIFQGFVEASPLSVMVRGTLERVLGAEALDAWYERTAEKQYTRQLLFSTVYELMSEVVFCIKPSLHAAYQGRQQTVGASTVAVYAKLQGIETTTSAQLVRYSASALAPAIAQLQGERAPWLAGYPVKIIDGNCIEATEHRLKPLRGLSAGALPGKSLVVFDPALGLVTDAFPCDDGHAQERALLGEVLPTIQAGELWLHDRHFCTREFFASIRNYPLNRSRPGAAAHALRRARSLSSRFACSTPRVKHTPFGVFASSWTRRPATASGSFIY